MTKTQTAAILATAILMSGGGAAAQDVQVKVQISPETIREVRRVVEVFIGQDFGKRLSAEINAAMRDVVVELKDLKIEKLARIEYGDWQNRDYRAQQTQQETKTLALGPNGQLELENLGGDIVIKAGSGRDVIVEAIRTARGRTEADAKRGLTEVRLDVQERGQRASVKVLYPQASNSGRSYSVSVAYNVTAPPGTAVTVSTMGGDVTVTGIRGDLSVDTMGGDVTITDAGRISKAHTLGGDVTITRIDSDGPLTAETMGGDILIQDVRARRIDANTYGGDVTLRNCTTTGAKLGTMAGTVEWTGALQPNGRYELQAQSGDLVLNIDGKTGFEFQGSTWAGDIKTDPTIQRTTSSGRPRQRSVRGTFGDGSAVVVATTFSGDIRVIKK